MVRDPGRAGHAGAGDPARRALGRIRAALFWAVLLVVAPMAGLAVGYGAFQGYRALTAPAPLQSGDFADVVREVGVPVVLLSTSTCPWCARARQWLDARGIPYRDCVTDRDPYARALFERLGGESVPQLVGARYIVTGFDTALFAQVADEAQEIAPGGGTPGMRCEVPVASPPAVRGAPPAVP